jgi:hypothetical protein
MKRRPITLKTIKLFIIIGLTCLIIQTLQLGRVKAQELQTYKPENIQTISEISPAFLELEMRPNEKRTIPITIKNSLVELSPSINFLKNPISSTKPKFEIQTNISVTENQNLPSNWISTQQIDLNNYLITITIPDKTEAGQYFPIVIFSPKIETSDNSLGVTSELSTILYINVINESKDYKGKISEFKIEQNSIFSFPKSISYTLTNDGNTFYHPRGQITITNPNGTILTYKYLINANFQPLYSQTSVTENFKINENDITETDSYLNIVGLINSTGYYKAAITAYPTQDQSNPITSTVDFFYIPQTLIIDILVFLGVITIFGLIIVNIPKKRGNSKF